MATVLIIENDDYLGQLLRDYLLTLDFTVLIARTGEEGMAQAIAKKPNVILLEGVLPDATGFQMCNRLRSCAQTKTTPIIMMSGLAHFPNQQKFALERGANEHISKPVKIVELGEMVDRYTSQPEKMKPLAPHEKTYSLWTHVHEALSDRLRQALKDHEPSKSEPKS
jgi:DNA-binding response OmpR family regulator